MNRRGMMQTTGLNLPLRFLKGRPAILAAFTLIELMAASTVLSVVLLLMVGMQDQMSRAWSNANRRTDATREARAACRLIAEDLACLVIRPMTSDNQFSLPAGMANQGIPFLYFSNGTPNPITIPSNQAASSYFFALSSRKPKSSGPEDLAIVGYYVASKLTTNVNGLVFTNYNLYRHYVPGASAVPKLDSWFSTSANNRTATLLFSPDPAQDDILSRNTCNLRITVYNRRDGNTRGWGNRVTNGLNYQCVSAGNADFYSGSKIQVEMSVYPEEYAQRIPYSSWGDSNNIQKYARSFEFRVDVPRD